MLFANSSSLAIPNKLTFTQVLAQPTVQVSFAASFVGLAGFFFYCIRTERAKTEKQVSWLLTFASSLVCTVCSLPSAFRFWQSRWDVAMLDGVENKAHTALVCFFISYLVLDLFLGTLYYKRRIKFVTGWFHHILYVFLLFWMLRIQIPSFFTTAALLELPTLILSCGSLKDEYRSDFWFGVTFFFLRLVFHSAMILPLKRYHRIRSLWMVATAILPLHLYWFYGKYANLILE